MIKRIVNFADFSAAIVEAHRYILGLSSEYVRFESVDVFPITAFAVLMPGT